MSISLTDRQREILRLLADGLSRRQVAHRLGCSPRTIDSHVAHARSKLGVADVPSAWRALGWLVPDSADYDN
jgi:DNA-binding CsgD family transcriptional regulator